MPPSRSLIRTTVEAYLVRHQHERTTLAPLLKALDHPADPTSRTTFAGHVTCSALVIDGTGRVLHIHHRASGKVLAFLQRRPCRGRARRGLPVGVGVSVALGRLSADGAAGRWWPWGR